MADKQRQYGDSSRTVDPTTDYASEEAVEEFHRNSDLDTRAESQHHTLGPAPTQAAAGNHLHDGGDSELLLGGILITGSRDSDQWRQSIIAALVRLGAEDNSIP